LHSKMRLRHEKSPHGIDPHQSIVVGKAQVGGNQSSNKASVTDLQELLPVTAVYMYVLYQYGL
jgi:hypothetical protein